MGARIDGRRKIRVSTSREYRGKAREGKKMKN